jgi:hypothetical protein
VPARTNGARAGQTPEDTGEAQASARSEHLYQHDALFTATVPTPWCVGCRVSQSASQELLNAMHLEKARAAPFAQSKAGLARAREPSKRRLGTETPGVATRRPDSPSRMQLEAVYRPYASCLYRRYRRVLNAPDACRAALVMQQLATATCVASYTLSR